MMVVPVYHDRTRCRTVMMHDYRRRRGRRWRFRDINGTATGQKRQRGEQAQRRQSANSVEDLFHNLFLSWIVSGKSSTTATIP